MKETDPEQPAAETSGCDCGCTNEPQLVTQLQPLSIPVAAAVDEDAPCCGPKPAPPCSPHERPGYRMWYFVEDFIQTSVGPVPRIATKLSLQDYSGTLRARLGVRRDMYRVAPGLYCAGNPNQDSPVLVTANYKLSFDSLRSEIAGLDAWILILDTRGVNVWCAAGKKTFSTQEVIRQVRTADLEKLVTHRQLILPQLGAPGVSAHEVKAGCGFKVIWGPVKAEDLKMFFKNGCTAERGMRQPTFSLWDRVVLIPVELSMALKPSLIILLAVFVISGISPGIFSFSAAWFRGVNGVAAYLLGLIAGAVVVPTLLPWLPMRQFYVKGIITGLVGGVILVLSLGTDIGKLESLTLLLFTTAISSYVAMNFTGCTPYTSPSGVEKEMRQGIPIQAAAVLVGLVAWIASPFMG